MTMSDDAAHAQVTRILQQFGRSDDASERLMPLVYDQLRAIAQRRMRQERGGHTLQATALVHEAYVRLVGDSRMNWQSRGHFYAAAAEAMRRILIDHARKRQAQKRGGGGLSAGVAGEDGEGGASAAAVRIELPSDLLELASEPRSDLVLAIDEALTQLEREDARAANVVRLRFFAGLSADETAEAMGISRRTVMREWVFARARLFELLNA